MYYEKLEKDVASARRKEKLAYRLFWFVSVLLGIGTASLIALIVYAVK